MTIVRKDLNSYVKTQEFDQERFNSFFDDIVENSGKKELFMKQELNDMKEILVQKILSKDEIEMTKFFDMIISDSNDRITQNSPQFTYLSASSLLRKLYKDASKERGFNYHEGYGDFYSFVKSMTEKGIYSDDLINHYTTDELREAGKMIDKQKDNLFSYAGLFLFNKNYLAKGYGGETYELPQERFLTCALYLMKDEPKEKRMFFVSESYWALSNHYIGLATPTLINAGRPMGTLSSCHILTMDDSLNSIMDVIKDTATFSQNGAGIGIFLGNLRSDGSWIRGYKGSATGVIGPIKLLNEIANYVNQLNVRKGGIAVYLPGYHADLFDFLDLRLKTGSQERRAHSIFTAVNLPDEFWRRLDARTTWTLFDPYEVKKKLGFDLNRLYDKKRLKPGEEPNPQEHAFTYHYRIAEKAPLELKRTVEAKDVYARIYISRKNTGTPYLYMSDTVARDNPNGHAGMPLGSNLCTEICQNMLHDKIEEDKLYENGVVIQVKRGEGLVTCNLSSLCLHNVFGKHKVDLQRIADIQYRMLDNVISLNRTPVPQATYTNNLYRAVGAGALGLETLLADEGISRESEEAAVFTDSIFEQIAYANILASHKLAMEKGSYPLFKGSKWETGEYFEERGYTSEKWLELKALVHQGLRNGYLMAIAPTGSNSVIMNGSPGIDGLYEVIYQERKDGMNCVIVPANYNFKTKALYKSAFAMDEMWSINIVAAAQKHIDQGISHNMHLHKNTKASEMLRFDYGAWDKGVKTIYYTKSDTGNVNRQEDCVYCSA